MTWVGEAYWSPWAAVAARFAGARSARAFAICGAVLLVAYPLAHDAAAFSLLFDPPGPVREVMAGAARWSAEPDPLGLGTGLHDRLHVAVEASFGADLGAATVARLYGVSESLVIELVNEAVGKAFRAWETRALQFDVQLAGDAVEGTSLGSEIDLFAEPMAHTAFGFTEVRVDRAASRLLTNGQRLPGDVILGADIFINGTRVLAGAQILFDSGLPLDRLANALQILVTHEIGHATGLGHPNEAISYDTDRDPYNLMQIDLRDPFANLIVSSIPLDTAPALLPIMWGGISRGAPEDLVPLFQRLLDPRLASDDAGGRDVLYPIAAGLVPGGGDSMSDCYAELYVAGIGNPGQDGNGVVKNRIVECTDGERCDQGACGDNACTFSVALCINQSEPALADCTPPDRLEKVQLKGALNNAELPPLSSSACSAVVDVPVELAFTKTGNLNKKSRTKVRVVAMAPRGTKPRRDRDDVTLRCRPRTVACPTTAYTTVSMLPDLPGGFFSHPWPNDIRRNGDGSIDLANYPGTGPIPLLGTILSTGARSTFGFGTNSAVYLQTTGAIDPHSLPSADETVSTDSPVLLVNLDDPSEPPAPLLVGFHHPPTSLRPENLLTLLPYPGHPLRGATRYAAIVLDRVLDEHGSPLRPSPLIAALDDAWDAEKPVGSAEWAALRAQRDAVFDYISTRTSRDPGQVVGFTVFTTQDVTSEMMAIAAAIEALPAPTPVSRRTGSCPNGALGATVSGELDLPKWQEGVPPYLTSGGAVVVESGKAVRQSTERVNFEVTYPCGPAPAQGWPILLYMNGTGACPTSHYITELGHDQLSNPLPYVVASISPLYGCERHPGLGDSALLFFNYVNPLAGRTNQLQQAADMLYLRRVVEGLVLSAPETGSAVPVETNDDIVVIAGHSQGALTVPHALAADPSFDGGFLSAGGGGLYLTLLQRGELREFMDTLAGQSLAELDVFHPLVHALQTITEVGDAANYGALIRDAHVLSIGGALDGCSPLEVVNILGTAARLQVANPILHPLFGSPLLEPPTVSFPVSANLSDGRTGLTVELDAGHFGAQRNPTLGRSFADSLAYGGTPTVNPAPILSAPAGPCPRYAPLRPLP